MDLNPGASAKRAVARRRSLLWIAGLLVVAIALMTTSCFFDAYNEQMVGPYRLLAVDSIDELSVVRDSEHSGSSSPRIGPVLMDVGWDERYIVATRKPMGYPDWPLLHYYIDMAEDAAERAPEDAVVEPLSAQEFEVAKAALGLPEFTKHFPKKGFFDGVAAVFERLLTPVWEW